MKNSKTNERLFIKYKGANDEHKLLSILETIRHIRKYSNYILRLETFIKKKLNNPSKTDMMI